MSKCYTQWFTEWHEIAKDTQGYETLDKWLVGFVRYAMVTGLLCETVEQANALMALTPTMARGEEGVGHVTHLSIVCVRYGTAARQSGVSLVVWRCNFQSTTQQCTTVSYGGKLANW